MPGRRHHPAVDAGASAAAPATHLHRTGGRHRAPPARGGGQRRRFLCGERQVGAQAGAGAGRGPAVRGPLRPRCRRVRAPGGEIRRGGLRAGGKDPGAADGFAAAAIALHSAGRCRRRAGHRHLSPAYGGNAPTPVHGGEMKINRMKIAAARRRRWSSLWLPAVLLMLAGAAWGQTGPYTISFSFALPGAVPPSYEVSIKSDGQGSYRSEDAPQAGAAQGEPYNLQFTVSEATRTRLFDLAKQANFFEGDFDYHKSKIANMGAKTLTYADSSGSHKTQYNYSMDAAILQITKLFQDLSSTLEFNRRLTFLYRFDK